MAKGATKFITVRVVEGGRPARNAARWPTPSPLALVKTAFFASDPNLGRILAAVGYAGIADLDQTLIDLYLDDVHVAVQGGRNPLPRGGRPARDAAAGDHRARAAGARSGGDTVWTCDLSHDYVTINADYRS